MNQPASAGRTRYLEIPCKSVLNRVRGMPFAWSINPYRGCVHRCVFCYARRTHTFLERSGLEDWGSVVYVKPGAPRVLRAELANPSWNGERVAIGTATDPYQAAEGRYRITRAILIELARSRTPAHLITRSPLIVRDVDVLQALARAAGVSVVISLPTLDENLARAVEPTVAPPQQRLRALRILAAEGIETGVAIAPVLPYLSDRVDDLRAVYRAAADAGASYAWYAALNLGDVARDTYGVFLRERHPELVEPYAALYRGKYAASAYIRMLKTRVHEARQGIPFSPPAGIASEPRLVQLQLL